MIKEEIKKIQKMVYKPETIESLITITHYYCDKCGIKGKRFQIETCDFCQKDYCKECHMIETIELDDSEDGYCCLILCKECRKNLPLLVEYDRLKALIEEMRLKLIETYSLKQTIREARDAFQE